MGGSTPQGNNSVNLLNGLAEALKSEEPLTVVRQQYSSEVPRHHRKNNYSVQMPLGKGYLLNEGEKEPVILETEQEEEGENAGQSGLAPVVARNSIVLTTQSAASSESADKERVQRIEQKYLRLEEGSPNKSNFN